MNARWDGPAGEIGAGAAATGRDGPAGEGGAGEATARWGGPAGEIGAGVAATGQGTTVEELLARFRAEPGPRETQLAAIRYAGLEAERAASWRGRVRVAPLAPELHAEYRRGAQTDRTLGSQASGNVDYAGLGLEDRFAVRGRWQLDRLIFDPDELRVAAEAIEVAELRQAVVDQVTRIYFERRRLQLEQLRPADDLDRRLATALRIDELTAALDGLTGGWFTERLGGPAGPGQRPERREGR